MLQSSEVHNQKIEASFSTAIGKFNRGSHAPQTYFTESLISPLRSLDRRINSAGIKNAIVIIFVGIAPNTKAGGYLKSERMWLGWRGC